ncbi:MULTISPECIES: GH1 family beta-glucosidase [Kosmotoga]|uniref:Beta-glucosidase n=1 Tax=Kosmotoga olearia (strain ATCC BAA-1733 / DSM 21960 / TBF 19.5.1) TaxID=521045 RepID=C5CHI5_KOSOT|nr:MULTISPECIES: GH1 family beta-glucosidase [Kosmotoga]ACR79740.1 beta-galactosidase [Kosmotoga olearia TBF 19.5.1]OAA21718.1 beta-glucosidase [Kosmotoga sp. DU53]
MPENRVSAEDFPEGFLWGVASSSYQIEGADLEDGKGPSIWTEYTKYKDNIVDGESGMIACDHYHRYTEDIFLMQDLGANAYRFSVSWPRIFPDGYGKPNPFGLDFYDRLIDNLLEAGITPFLTLYHYDLPLKLQQEHRGWESRETISYFLEYAHFLFKKFGDRVKYWITLNQPLRISHRSYIDGKAAPGKGKSPKDSFQVAHHLLLAHAGATKIMKQEIPDGKIGISNSSIYVEPIEDTPEHKRAALLLDQFYNDWFYLPPVSGKYPEELMLELKKRGWAPEMEPDDMDNIVAEQDFWGINYYTRALAIQSNNSLLGFAQASPKFPATRRGAEIYPCGLFLVLKKIHKNFDSKQIYITENGMDLDSPVASGKLEDTERIIFLKEHIVQLKKAVDSGIPIKGYFVWSLLDNFEWTSGYTLKFGLVYVDRNNGLKRIPKASYYFYRDFIAGKISL